MRLQTGYYRLLKTNPAFRKLWYGQVVSELGSWLNSIAIYALILKLTGSGMAMALAMMAKLLPVVAVSPLAGVMIDRMSRRRIMIVSDLLRSGVVLGFLLVGTREDLWLLYALVILEVSLSGFFEPARSAIIPSITSREDWVTANALGGSTWSAMLAFGAALGGVIVGLFGIEAAFILDSFTFLISAWFIYQIPASVESKKNGAGGRPGQGGFQDLVDAARYLLAKPGILVASLLKTGLAVSGGVMTLIPLYAHKILSTPSAVSMGIGVMYSCRGIGAAFGPLIVKRIFGSSSRVLQKAIFAAFIAGGMFYFLLANTDTLWGAALSIAMAHFFISIIWVFSTALIHLQAEERFLGRIFSAEMALLTLMMGLSNWGVGAAVDRFAFSLGAAASWMGAALMVSGVLWGGFLLLARHRLK